MRVREVGMIAGLLTLAAPLLAHEPPKNAGDANRVSTSAREAEKAVDAFHAALDRGDTQGAAALMTEDALIFESGGVERSKAEYAAHHLPADASFSRQVSSVVSRRAGNANGTLAWIASEGRTTGKYRGKALDLLTTETIVLRRTSSGWKIAHIHWSSAKQ